MTHMRSSGAMMNNTLVVAAMLVAVSLMAGVSRYEVASRPSSDPQGSFEQQVEEGFGHLDRLPNH
jgi:hypothetical protein